MSGRSSMTRSFRRIRAHAASASFRETGTCTSGSGCPSGWNRSVHERPGELTTSYAASKMVRFEVIFRDDSGDHDPFARCFRFEPGPHYQRWTSHSVDPCPDTGSA